LTSVLVANAMGRVDVVTQKQYTAPVKSAVIPQVRVGPELRAELEAVLRQGESLSEFVEASVRSAVEFRRVQTRFPERFSFRKAGRSPTGRELVLPFGATGYVAPCEIVNPSSVPVLAVRHQREEDYP
jgi:hypothetical protein